MDVAILGEVKGLRPGECLLEGPTAFLHHTLTAGVTYLGGEEIFFWIFLLINVSIYLYLSE